MATLANFPMLSQLSDSNEVNRLYDCVPTAIASCLEYVLKRPFDGGAVKDAVYGAGYQGSTAAANYVAYCKEQGVDLVPLNGTPAQLVDDIRFWLGQDQPLIATEPDPYVNSSLGWTHVIAFFGYDTGSLTCLDPYGGHSVTLSDAEWIARLQFNQVWKLEKEASMGVPNGWRDDGTTLFSPSHIQGGPEVPITGPFREYVLGNAWRPSDRFIEVGHHVDALEYSHTGLGGGFRQASLYSLLEKPDSGSQAGQVLYGWQGVEANYVRGLYEGALAHIATLEQELAKPVIDPGSVANRLQSIELEAQNIIKLATSPV